MLYKNKYGEIVVHNNRKPIPVGTRHGMLEVIEYLGVKQVVYDYIVRKSFVRCICDCGRIVEIPVQSFKKQKSCGCLRRKHGKEEF